MHAMLQAEKAETNESTDLVYGLPAGLSTSLPTELSTGLLHTPMPLLHQPRLGHKRRHQARLGAARARPVNTPQTPVSAAPLPQVPAFGTRAPSLELPAVCLEAMLHSLDVALMICTQHGQVRFMNEAARRAMASCEHLRVDSFGHLVVPVGREGVALMAALARSARNKRHQLMSLGVGTKAVTLAVQPLAVTCEGESDMALLVFSRQQAAPDLALQMLAHQHELTRAEVRVLKALLAGQSVPEIAIAHRRKESTIRAQVASIRGKLGLKRVGQIMRVVAGLPPVITAVRQG